MIRPRVPSNENSHIMMDWMIIILHINAFLPLTEAVQAVVCMMGNFQILLITYKMIKYIKWGNCICNICVYEV